MKEHDHDRHKACVNLWFAVIKQTWEDALVPDDQLYCAYDMWSRSRVPYPLQKQNRREARRFFFDGSLEEICDMIGAESGDIKRRAAEYRRNGWKPNAEDKKN